MIDQTEAALARVLSLCSNGGVEQQDVDALQCHDEATLLLLEVNDDDAKKVCRRSPKEGGGQKGSLWGALNSLVWICFGLEKQNRSVHTRYSCKAASLQNAGCT